MKCPSAFLPFAQSPRWCAWRQTLGKKGRVAKVPYVQPGRRASTSQPETWLEFRRADSLAECFEDMGCRAGLGILLGPLPDGGTLIALDLDACCDPETGTFADWAQPILAKFGSCYVETSPSRSGLHILAIATEATLAAAEAITSLGKAGRKWKRPALPGAKAAAIELLVGGYITVTANHVPASPQHIPQIGADALVWLLREVVPAFLGYPAPEPASSPLPPVDAATSQPAAALRTPMVRASRSRLARFMIDCEDAEAQMLAAFWGNARKARDEWAPSCVPHDHLLQLPGADAGSTRSSSTLWRTKKRLQDAGHLRLSVSAIPPRHNLRGTAATYEVVPLLVHCPEKRERDDILRIPVTIWRDQLLLLPPFPLRIFLWLLATQDGAPFTLSATATARGFRVKPERIANAIAVLIEGARGFLEAIEAPNRLCRLPGVFRLGRAFRDGRDTSSTHTPHPPLVA